MQTRIEILENACANSLQMLQAIKDRKLNEYMQKEWLEIKITELEDVLNIKKEK